VAVWKQKLNSDKDVNALMPGIIEKLVTEPEFKLPPATLGHTRHYMPWHKGWKPESPEKAKTLVFDAFVALEPDREVVFVWPDVRLEESEADAIDLVLSNLNYFGRRESVCDARVVAVPRETEINCQSIEPEKGTVADGYEPVRVLCADPATALANDHTPKKKRTSGSGKNKKTQWLPDYDPDWHLCMETRELHKQAWSDPPGSRWVTYQRRSDSFIAEPTTASRDIRREKPTIAARFILDGPVLPLVTETLYLGEIARQALQGKYGKLFDGKSSAVFSGKDENGNPLRGHGHAFFLPTDEDGDGRLDHLAVWCESGFSHEELHAVDNLLMMRRPGAGVELNLMLTGLIDADQTGIAPDIPLFSKAVRWRSVTPFVPTRHYKRRGRKRDTCAIEQFPAMVLCEEMERRGLPVPKEIRLLDRCLLWDHRKRSEAPSARSLAWLQFRRERVFGNGRRGSHPGCGFEIEFPAPVRGPLALGYGCHFGLGLFAPVD